LEHNRNRVRTGYYIKLGRWNRIKLNREIPEEQSRDQPGRAVYHRNTVTGSGIGVVLSQEHHKVRQQLTTETTQEQSGVGRDRAVYHRNTRGIPQGRVG
jgi:hypothetical protein